MNQKKYSLYFILGLIVFAIAIIWITLSSGYEYFKTKERLKNQIHENSQHTLLRLQQIIIPYVESYSINEYKNLIANEMKEKNFLAIIIKDYNMGKIVGKTYYLEGMIKDKNWNIVEFDETNPQHQLDLTKTYLQEQIVVKNSRDEEIAMIELYSSDKFMNEELLNIIKEGIIITILTSFVLMIITFFLIERIILKPIKEIISTITQNNSNEVPLKLIHQSGYKEIYELSLTINNMIEKSQQKDLLLHHQSRFASMGEMIGNIAHQWRQPLNALSITIQKVERFYYLDKLDKAIMEKSIAKSMQLINKMSSTIDDFMGFFRKDKVQITFNIADAIEETLSLLEASLKNHFILLDFEKPTTNLMVTGYKGEFTQALLNIISNAKDALIINKVINPKIEIVVHKEASTIKINICDNAGGIPKNIFNKIFDPYFTTKEENKGTGIGLYMSKTIIEQNMQGQLYATNIQDGACFTIILQEELKKNG